MIYDKYEPESNTNKDFWKGIAWQLGISIFFLVSGLIGMFNSSGDEDILPLFFIILIIFGAILHLINLYGKIDSEFNKIKRHKRLSKEKK
jgi:quinol-cytochrome oxidoreductase complex cytochrome b subunit